MNKSYFKIIHSSRSRGPQSSAKHSLPTGLHEMAMRALPLANNDRDAENTASTGSETETGCLIRCLKNAPQLKWQSSWKLISLTLLVWLKTDKRKTFTPNWTTYSADTECCGLKRENCTPTFFSAGRCFISNAIEIEEKVIYHTLSVWWKAVWKVKSKCSIRANEVGLSAYVAISVIYQL